MPLENLVNYTQSYNIAYPLLNMSTTYETFKYDKSLPNIFHVLRKNMAASSPHLLEIRKHLYKIENISPDKQLIEHLTINHVQHEFDN